MYESVLGSTCTLLYSAQLICLSFQSTIASFYCTCTYMCTSSPPSSYSYPYITAYHYLYDANNGSTIMILYSTICTVPSVPRLLSVTRNLSDGFELNWLPPREPNGRPVYEIEYGTDDTNFTTVDTGSRDTYYNLTGLQQNTTYYIRVVAVNYITFGGLPLRGNESETVTGVIIPEPSEDTNCMVDSVGRYHMSNIQYIIRQNISIQLNISILKVSYQSGRKGPSKPMKQIPLAMTVCTLCIL